MNLPLISLPPPPTMNHLVARGWNKMTSKVPCKSDRFTTLKDAVVSAAAVRTMLSFCRKRMLWKGTGGGCVLREGARMWPPGTPTSSLPYSFLPRPQETAESERTRDMDGPCRLCCVRARQDEDGDGGRKDDGQDGVRNF